MLVGERMSYPVVSVSPDTPINEALALMKRQKIRRAPVMKNGKLVGIVSDKDILNASASPATSLSIWELNYLISKISVKDVMSKEVLTVPGDTPIEEAARIMADNKIGGLPVTRGEEVIGMITETDLFKLFLELMGARESGVRVTMIVQNKPGELARITQNVAQIGGNFIAFGQFLGDDPTNRTVTFKISGLTEEEVREKCECMKEEIIDIRTA